MSTCMHTLVWHMHEYSNRGRDRKDQRTMIEALEAKQCICRDLYVPYQFCGTVDDMQRSTITNQCLSNWRDYSDNKPNNLQKKAPNSFKFPPQHEQNADKKRLIQHFISPCQNRQVNFEVGTSIYYCTHSHCHHDKLGNTTQNLFVSFPLQGSIICLICL